MYSQLYDGNTQLLVLDLDNPVRRSHKEKQPQHKEMPLQGGFIYVTEATEPASKIEARVKSCKKCGHFTLFDHFFKTDKCPVCSWLNLKLIYPVGSKEAQGEDN